MDVKFEGVSFNADYNSKLTEKEFVENGIRDGQFEKFAEADRPKMLKDAYKAIKDAMAPAAKA